MTRAKSPGDNRVFGGGWRRYTVNDRKIRSSSGSAVTENYPSESQISISFKFAGYPFGIDAW